MVISEFLSMITLRWNIYWEEYAACISVLSMKIILHWSLHTAEAMQVIVHMGNLPPNGRLKTCLSFRIITLRVSYILDLVKASWHLRVYQNQAEDIPMATRWHNKHFMLALGGEMSILTAIIRRSESHSDRARKSWLGSQVGQTNRRKSSLTSRVG